MARFHIVLTGLNAVGLIIIFYLFFNNSDTVVYVDAIKLLAQYKGTETARQELALKAEIWNANLDSLKKELNDVTIQVDQQGANTPPRERQLLSELLEAKQNQYYAYEQSVKSQYQKEDQEISGKVLSKVNDFIKRYGEKRGYSVILAATQYGNVAYGRPDADITEEVVAGLNAEYARLK